MPKRASCRVTLAADQRPLEWAPEAPDCACPRQGRRPQQQQRRALFCINFTPNRLLTQPRRRDGKWPSSSCTLQRAGTPRSTAMRSCLFFLTHQIHRDPVTSDLASHPNSLHHCPSTGSTSRPTAGQRSGAITPLFHRFWPLSSLKNVFCGEFFANPMIPLDRG
jgi:hypothetical protein